MCKVGVLDIFLVLFLGSFQLTTSVKINNLTIPAIVTPSNEPIILDCDYSVDLPQDEGLVVKWFFNKNFYPVYQWILNGKPQDLGILKGRLDLSYKASEDKNTWHRALKIIRVNTELAGNYTCSVSSLNNEETQMKTMQMFVPEKSMKLTYPSTWNNDNNSKILCIVEDIFPKPQMKLYLNDDEIENSTLQYHERPNGLFNAEIFASPENMTGENLVACELEVEFANYTVKQEGVFFGATNSSAWRIKPWFICMIFVCFYY